MPIDRQESESGQSVERIELGLVGLRTMAVVWLLACLSLVSARAQAPRAAYRNDALGIEVHYPTLWHIKQSSGTVQRVALERPAHGADEALSIQFFLQKNANSGRVSVHAWYKAHTNGLKVPPEMKVIDTLLGGRPAVSQQRVSDLGRAFDLFVAEKGTDIFRVVVIQAPTSPSMHPEVSEILSSLAFITCKRCAAK